MTPKGSALLGAVVRDDAVPPPESREWADLSMVIARADGTALRAGPSRAVLRISGVATFSVERGEVVTVDRAPDAPEDLVRAWLHGPVVALLAGQQRCFALHATIVDLDGCRIALTGRRGAGKSTNSLASVLAGARLVADDVAVIRVDAAGRATVRPFGRLVHVRRDTAVALGLDLSEARPVPTQPDKVGLPAPASRAPEPLDLLVVLEPGDHRHPSRFAIGGVDAFAAVSEHTYRPDIVGAVWPRECFAWQVGVVRAVAVERLFRPETWCVDEVVELLSDASRTVVRLRES